VSVEDSPRFYRAKSLDDAVAALSERGREGAPLAGATWIMRAPIRDEKLAPSYVAISRVEELRQVAVLGHEIKIGAAVTHAELAAALASVRDCRALAIAAERSANPAIRHQATVGGNLCTPAFAAADLVPALLCLDAEVELAHRKDSGRMPLERFLAMRMEIEPGTLLRCVIVPRTPRRSAHIRLPLRKAGDYPVAIVSLAATLGSDGRASKLAIAVGSVEPVARRWTRLEHELLDRPLDPQSAGERAEAASADFVGRDGVEAPGWYRVKVLPALVRRAVEALSDAQ